MNSQDTKPDAKTPVPILIGADSASARDDYTVVTINGVLDGGIYDGVGIEWEVAIQ